MLMRIRKSQSTLEYALVVSVIVGALVGLNTYIKRGVQGKLKDSADSIGDQFDPETFTQTRTLRSVGTTKTNELRDVATNDNEPGGGITTDITEAETVYTDKDDLTWSSTE